MISEAALLLMRILFPKVVSPALPQTATRAIPGLVRSSGGAWLRRIKIVYFRVNLYNEIRRILRKLEVPN